MILVERLQQTLRVLQVPSRFPCIFVVVAPSPFNQILDFSVHSLFLQDSFWFEVFLVNLYVESGFDVGCILGSWLEE